MSERVSMTSSTWVGERVELRAKEPGDIPCYLANGVIEDMRLYGGGFVPHPVTPEQRREAILKPVAGDGCSLAITSLGGELVGSINAIDCDSRSGSFSYGIGIFSEVQRRGYALDAVRLLLRYYFEERRYHKAGAQVYSFNQSSIALQEKLGFQQEGRLREVVYTEGAHHDLLVFGITAAEFFSKWGAPR